VVGDAAFGDKDSEGVSVNVFLTESLSGSFEMKIHTTISSVINHFVETR